MKLDRVVGADVSCTSPIYRPSLEVTLSEFSIQSELSALDEGHAIQIKKSKSINFPITIEGHIFQYTQSYVTLINFSLEKHENFPIIIPQLSNSTPRRQFSRCAMGC
jgi:hypothetical protein